MNKLKIFENEEFGQIRTTIDEDGNVLFCGSDVAKALGYKDTVNSLKRHCKEDGVAFRHLIDNLGRSQKTKFINEGNVYRLIIKSKLPSAEKFEKWVFDKVLPSIRAYGGYITKAKLEDIFHNPGNLSIFLRQMLKVAEENEQLKDKVNVLEPKAEYFDELMDSNLLVNFTTTAKELKIKPTQFTEFLIAKKYVYRDERQNIQPRQESIYYGYFEIKEFCRNGHYGTQTLITPKGRQFFIELLKKCEVL